MIVCSYCNFNVQEEAARGNKEEHTNNVSRNGDNDIANLKEFNGLIKGMLSLLDLSDITML